VHDSTLEPVHESDRGTIYRGAAEALYDLMREQGQRPSLVISDVRNGTYSGKMVGGPGKGSTHTHREETAMHGQDTRPECWLPIEGWNGYEVSDHGRIRSWKKSRRSPMDHLPRVLRTSSLPRGYRMVTLKERGMYASIYVHRAVLLAFVGPCPDGHECAHADSDPSNNRLANLRWATAAENTNDKRRHGTVVHGADQHCAVVTEEQARGILNHAGSHADAARVFGVKYMLAYKIRTRRTWKHL